jgi:hypothetical protein
MLYENSSGLLARNSSDQLVDAGCCCGFGCYQEYKVTLAGLGGTFEKYNGVWTVAWDLAGTEVCEWRYLLPEGGLVRLWMDDCDDSPLDPWVVSVGSVIYCAKFWTKAHSSGCDVEGAYSEFYCGASYCPDTLSCSKSAGATCNVSAV